MYIRNLCQKDVRGSFFDVVNVNFKTNELSDKLDKLYKVQLM